VKPTLSIALILSAVLLTACGGSSKSKQSVTEFSLDSYEGRTVNSDSMAGTWVSVSEGEVDIASDDLDLTGTFVTKEYFVILETDNSTYQKASCHSDFHDVDPEEDDRFSFEGIMGTFTNNKTFIGNRDYETITNEFSYIISESFQMVKISDSTESIGLVENTISGLGTSTFSINCFFQNSQKLEVTSGPEAGHYAEAYFDIGADRNLGLGFGETVGIDTVKYMYNEDAEFNSGEGDSVGYSIDGETTLTQELTYNASNDSQDVSGTIQIQLPLQ